MKRKLFTQIINEWQSNIWLAVELLIVSVVMWYITDNLYIQISICNEPRGFDTEHCYLINYSQLTDNSMYYIKQKTPEQDAEDMAKFIERLRERPEIEAVAAGMNAHPYNGSNSWVQMHIDSLSINILYKQVTPEFPKVFRLHGANGETPEQLTEMLKEPYTVMFSDNAMSEHGIQNMKDYIGKDFYNITNTDSMNFIPKKSFVPTRYDDYSPIEASNSKSMIMSITESNCNWCDELVVRVRENMDHDFIENLMNDAESHLRIGNYYIASVQSFDDIRNIHQKENKHVMTVYITGAIFLAVNIFLGLLGSFWFRTRRRTSEIAIRKANGATRGDIFRRVIGEGELILLTVMPAAIVIDRLLTYFELNTNYLGGFFVTNRFIWCVAISWEIMALMIFLGVALPANRAMKTAPATALKEE